jgi:Tfp pilus assembly protein PilV
MNIVSARNQQGFMVLLAVLVVGAISLSVALVLLRGGSDIQRSVLVSQQTAQARQLADACAEEALAVVRANTSYTGTATVSLGQGSCTYTVANPGGTARTITTSGTVNGNVRKLQLNATIGTTISVTSWQDIP